MLHFYTEVPMCPKCNSSRTGYFIYGQYQKGNLLYSHLKKGEFVYVKALTDNTNCFCVDCGVQWEGKINTKIVDGKTLKKIKDDKGITQEYIENIKNNLMEIKKESENILEQTSNLKEYKRQRKIKSFLKKIIK